MSDTGKQSPLGVNALSSLLQNTGLTINPIVPNRVGVSHNVSSYTFGSIVDNSCLRLLTYAINDGYNRGQLNSTTYNNLISIGSSTIPALGNSKAPTFTYTGAANTGDATSTGAQTASWLPYDSTNDASQWGYLRLIALQAWNEFNWNGTSATVTPEYKDFMQSFITGYSFIDYTNATISAMSNSPTFLQGTYSNMNDLITADIAGVNLAFRDFGQDLIALGKVIDTTTLSSFGLPSNLLQTLRKYNAITQSLSLALIASDISVSDLENILSGATIPTVQQEQQMYGAFLIVVGVDLADILIPVNCKTKGLESLADLLNPKKLFPNSYQALTVPVYNASSGPTNSKTYYPIYGQGGTNQALTSPAVSRALSGSTVTGIGSGQG